MDSMSTAGGLMDSINRIDDPQATVPARFAAMAQRHPHRVALIGSSWQPTYAELHSTAAHLAGTLQANGGSSGDRVALLMRHDAPLLAAMLAVLQAGRIVVVLNPSDPPARLRQLLDDADPQAIITDSGRRALAAEVAGDRSSIISFEAGLTQESSSVTQVTIAPDDVAFLIYTSGSTGRPKAVMRTHAVAVHQAYRIEHEMVLCAEDRVTLLASLSGGQGITTSLLALLNGATLCPYPVIEIGVSRLADWIRERGITVVVAAASLFRHFLRTLPGEHRFPEVRLVWLASEPVTADDFAAWQRHFPQHCVLYHALSSSETGTIAHQKYRHGDRVAAGRLPAGRPTEDVAVTLVDDDGCEVPDGEPGEILVKSRFLGAGYWRNDAASAERFSGAGAERVFHSADLARRNADGMLVFAGRKDARLKIRGYRIEPGEVEDALRRHGNVAAVVVCGQQRPDGELELVAYIVARTGHKVTSEALRLALSDRLPGHMIPASFFHLDCLPLTPHGKIDRMALKQMGESAHADREAPGASELPMSDTEELLTAIWTKAFAGKTVRRHDSFFDLGGESMIALVVAARVYAVCGVELELRAFAQYPTLSQLAARIDELRQSADVQRLPPLAPVSRASPLPMSFAQERIWKYSQTPEAMARYTMSGAYTIRGPLHVQALMDSINCIIRRHEILRTTFAEIDSRAVQIVHPQLLLPIPHIDLSSEPTAREQTREFRSREANRPFDLSQLPLLRFFLLRIGPNEHQLIHVHHHLLSDRWSWRGVFFRELALVYAARLNGAPSPLPEFEPLQYGDYAAWQRDLLRPDGAVYRKTVAWWKTRFEKKPPPLALSCRRRKQVAIADPSVGQSRWEVDEQTSRRLERLGIEEGVTFYTLRLAVIVALLAKDTGCPDVVLGAYVSNRHRMELQNMFGYFANLTTMRIHCERKRSFREWLHIVSNTVGEIQAHGELPYEQLCDEVRKQGIEPPEIRLIFSGAEQPDRFRFSDLEWTYERRREAMPWGFNLSMFRAERERLSVAFDARIYDPEGARTLINGLLHLLDIVATNPDATLGSLLAFRRCPNRASL